MQIELCLFELDTKRCSGGDLLYYPRIYDLCAALCVGAYWCCADSSVVLEWSLVLTLDNPRTVPKSVNVDFFP